jgi:hypothetical protein
MISALMVSALMTEALIIEAEPLLLLLLLF